MKSTQAHGDRPGRDLGEAGRGDDARLVDGPCQSCCQRERDRQTVGHPDDHIADGFRTCEMALAVGVCRHDYYLSTGTPETVASP